MTTLSSSSEGGDSLDEFKPLSDEIRLQLLGPLLDTVPGFIAVFQLADLRLAYLNKSALKRLNPENVLNIFHLTLPEITGLSSLQKLQSEILPHARVLGRWVGECELRDGWGSEFKTEVIFATQNCGHKDYLCMYARESSNPKNVEETHFTDRHLLHALMANAPDSIYFKDAASRFLRVSRALAKKFGLEDPSKAIGKTDFDIFTAEHASAAYATEQNIIRTGIGVLDQEEMETWEEGRITWCSSSKLPLLGADGKIIGTFGISRDITAKKTADHSRRELEVQLQLAQKLESIGRLAAGVAHEINTPTQFITDNVRFLKDAFAKIESVLVKYRAMQAVAMDPSACVAAGATVDALAKEIELDYLSSEIPRCLEQSMEGLNRVARIVLSLKEFAHPNSPELTPVDLNRIIETSLVVSRHEWKYVAEVITDLAPDLPPVPCVADEFNQVILNLVINAAHAIGDALKIRGGNLGKIFVRTRREPPWIVVEIEDTGTGIPDEARDHVFEPFFTTKSVGKGTGQGLAIVHTVVVKHHHGTIDLSTVPGQGTKFTLRLPEQRIAPPSPDPSVRS